MVNNLSCIYRVFGEKGSTTVQKASGRNKVVLTLLTKESGIRSHHCYAVLQTFHCASFCLFTLKLDIFFKNLMII